MSGEHIGKRQLVGLGKESVAGTPVAASYWFPKEDAEFKPVTEKDKDESAWGVIEKIQDSQVTKNLTEVKLSGIARDELLGHLAKALCGTEQTCVEFSITPTGTFVVGETVTGGTSAATGVIRKIEGSGATTKLFVTVTSGTFTTGAGETLTGGTSAATGTGTYSTGVRSHLFTVLQTNNHTTYTLYEDDDVDNISCAYGMLDTLDLTINAGEMVRFESNWKAKKLSGGASTTPAFSSENVFLARHASLKIASTLAGLESATALAVKMGKFSWTKTLTDHQNWGDDDIASIHNQELDLTGEIEALFNSTTLRDYVLDGTKRAARIEITNTDVSIGSGNTTNPKLTIDIARVSFEDWSNKAANGELVYQKMGIQAEYDADNSFMFKVCVRNDTTAAY